MDNFSVIHFRRYTAQNMGMRFVGNVHLVAGSADFVPRVLSLLEAEGVRTRGNPDIYIREYRSFGVDEARELRERASTRAVAGAHRIFIIATSGMTNEAQNALLKTLEEPPADAGFFFILPSPEALLPTLRSRAQHLVLGTGEASGGLVDARAFLAASSEKRLDMLKPLLEKDEDDKRDVGSVLVFLASLERAVAASSALTKRDALESIYRARKYMGDKGALVKALLEQLALLTPRM